MTKKFSGADIFNLIILTANIVASIIYPDNRFSATGGWVLCLIAYVYILYLENELRSEKGAQP